jgi:hypothetical protein
MSIDQSYIVYFNQNAEQVLLQVGYDSMNLDDKNSLVALIANKEGIAYSEINDAYILSYHKQIKKDAINANCENTIVSGFKSSNGHTYTLDRDDQMNMLGLRNEIMSDTTISVVPWKTVDVGMIDHQRDVWLSMYSEAFAFKKTQLLKCDTLKQQVNAATTHDELIKIVWS